MDEIIEQIGPEKFSAVVFRDGSSSSSSASAQ